MQCLQQHPKASNLLSKVTFPRSHNSLCWLAAVGHKKKGEQQMPETWDVLPCRRERSQDSLISHSQLHTAWDKVWRAQVNSYSDNSCHSNTYQCVWFYGHVQRNLYAFWLLISGQKYILWGFFKPRLHPAVTGQWATLWWNILALRKKWLFADVSPTEINLSNLFQPPLNIYTKQEDSSCNNCLWQRHNPLVWQVTNSLWGRFLLN